MSEAEIITVNGIIIQDRKLLVVKDDGRFVLPGGRMESGESDIETLNREMAEELGIDVSFGKVELVGYFDFEKAYKSDLRLQMRVYHIQTSQIPQMLDDITELLWLDKGIYKNHNDLPKAWFDVIFEKLLERNIIDLLN